MLRGDFQIVKITFVIFKITLKHVSNDPSIFDAMKIVFKNLKSILNKICFGVILKMTKVMLPISKSLSNIPLIIAECKGARITSLVNNNNIHFMAVF